MLFYFEGGMNCIESNRIKLMPFKLSSKAYIISPVLINKKKKYISTWKASKIQYSHCLVCMCICSAVNTFHTWHHLEMIKIILISASEYPQSTTHVVVSNLLLAHTRPFSRTRVRCLPLQHKECGTQVAIPYAGMQQACIQRHFELCAPWRAKTLNVLCSGNCFCLVYTCDCDKRCLLNATVTYRFRTRRRTNRAQRREQKRQMHNNSIENSCYLYSELLNVHFQFFSLYPIYSSAESQPNSKLFVSVCVCLSDERWTIANKRLQSTME